MTRQFTQFEVQPSEGTSNYDFDLSFADVISLTSVSYSCEHLAEGTARVRVFSGQSSPKTALFRRRILDQGHKILSEAEKEEEDFGLTYEGDDYPHT